MPGEHAANVSSRVVDHHLLSIASHPAVLPILKQMISPPINPCMLCMQQFRIDMHPSWRCWSIGLDGDHELQCALPACLTIVSLEDLMLSLRMTNRCIA